MKQRRTLLRQTVALALAVLLTILLPMTVARADRDGKVPRDGFDLYWHSVGKGDPVILLSGGPGMDADMLRPVAAELGKDYECILLEQRGTGRSRMRSYNSATINLRQYVEDLEALRENLRQPKLVLMGNSWGMVLALAYGAAHPDRVRGIITMGSGPIAAEYFGSFNDNLKTRMWPEDKEALKQAGQIRDYDRKEAERLRAIIPAYFYAHDRGIRYAQGMRFDGFNPSINGIAMGALRREKFDLRPSLRRLNAPVLLLQGRQDPAGEGNLYETKAALPNARMIFFDRCGHLPWAEQPDKFYRACRSFLNEIYRSR